MTLHQDLLWHAGVSTLRVWAAFLLSAVLAIPIGMAMSVYRPVRAALEPVIDFIRYLPVPALVPLAIIWFGVGENNKIFLLWLGTFFQLVLLVAEDMNRVPHEYVEIAFTLGARPGQILRDVAFRAMAPSLVDNLRISLGWCWTYLIVAEIVAASSGLGYVIWVARRYMQTPQVMAGVVAIGLIGLITDQLLRRCTGACSGTCDHGAAELRRVRRHHQALRRPAGGRSGLRPFHSAQPVRRVPRPLGLRQDHADAHDRRAGPSECRRDPARWASGRRARPAPRHGVSGLFVVSLAHRARERRLRHEIPA